MYHTYYACVSGQYAVLGPFTGFYLPLQQQGVQGHYVKPGPTKLWCNVMVDAIWGTKLCTCSMSRRTWSNKDFSLGFLLWLRCCFPVESWTYGLDQAPVPHTIQTSDPDLSKGFDPDLWSRPLEWYTYIYIYLYIHNVLVSWCLVQWWLHVFGFPALQLSTLPSGQATNFCKAAAKLSSFQAALVVKLRC